MGSKDKDTVNQKLRKEIGKWKGRAVEACEKACFNCEEYAPKKEKTCANCRIMKIKEDAGK